LDNFEVVAVGVFDDPPDLESDLLDVLKPHDLTVSFRILMPYKAPPAQGAVVDVLVNSDMLAVPGGDVSRYAARFSEGQRLATEIDSITAQLLVLDQRRETGDLTVAEYENESTKLNGARDRLITQSGAIPTRMWVQSHGDNFYTLGGAIRPGVKYLVGLKSSPGDPQTYLLDELPTSTRDIYWGEMAEDIVAALNDLVP
jgi:hypothetical protein